MDKQPGQAVSEIYLCFFLIFILGEVRRGVCRGSPWTGGQCFRVTLKIGIEHITWSQSCDNHHLFMTSCLLAIIGHFQHLPFKLLNALKEVRKVALSRWPYEKRLHQRRVPCLFFEGNLFAKHRKQIMNWLLCNLGTEGLHSFKCPTVIKCHHNRKRQCIYD